MKRLLVALLAVSCIGISIPVAQNINKSVQLSQDPSGPIAFDNQNGVYFPGKIYNNNNQVAPIAAPCGTTPTIVGTSTAGLITEGSGATTTCAITFASAYPATPYCFAQTGTVGTPVGLTATPGGVAFSHSSSSTSLKFNYFCFGQQP